MIRSERTWSRIVAHADMDAFYAAIEQLDDAALRGRPVLVGSRSDRGVVLTASYEARPYGVGSAMPMAKARRLCPSAVIVPPRFDRYQEVSRTIMRVFSDFSPEVEALSLDEAFLDMTGSEQLFGDPQSIGRRLKHAVWEATGGLTASVGLSATKYVAKVASARQKPDGLTVVPPDEAQGLARPASRVLAVGRGAQGPGTPSPNRSADHRGGGWRRSKVPSRETREGRPTLPRSRPRGRFPTRHWPAIHKEHWIGTHTREGHKREGGPQTSPAAIS